MPKKQWNARLNEETILAIKIKAKEWGCSEGEVIERWANGKPNRVEAPEFDDEWKTNVPVTSPAGFIAPKGSFSKADLKALIAGNGRTEAIVEPPRSAYPFTFEKDGETYMIRQERNGLGLYWVGEDGEQRKRGLTEVEAQGYLTKH